VNLISTKKGWDMTQDIKITAEPRDPETCRFIVDKPLFPNASVYFGDKEKAAGSPLAAQLFELEGVESLLIQDNVLTVTAQTSGDWMPLAKQVGTIIRSVLESDDAPVPEAILSSLPPAEEITQRIQELFEKQINPAIAAHGGFVELIDVKGNEVFIRMGGGCQGCGMANVTLRNGIEKAIRSSVPDVGAIMDTTDHASGRNPYYQPQG
jgi:Fe-S cluster biogenesis protein NfuA